MKTMLDPGRERRSLYFHDNIPFSQVGDLTLYMSLITMNGKSETRLAGGVDTEIVTERQPCIIWINGAGWRGCDKNLMVPEMTYLADHGYAMAFIDFRSSKQGHYPDQLYDCKTAVRFLRKNADKYNLDPDRIGVLGRSAGGHMALFMALELPLFEGEEYKEYSSSIKCAVNLFGPVDLRARGLYSLEEMKNPSFMFKTMAETREGMFLGIKTEEEYWAKCDEASPINYLNKNMKPLMIMHGDDDATVPFSISENLYERLCQEGLEERTEFYVVHGAGHGTREFFQEDCRNAILNFFDRYL